MYIVGTKGNDAFYPDPAPNGGTTVIGMAGDDILMTPWTASLQRYHLNLIGGSGDDLYTIFDGANAIINDTSGNDSLYFPLTALEFMTYVITGAGTQYHYDGNDGKTRAAYYFECSKFKVTIIDYLGEGKIEKFMFTDSTYSFDALWSQLSKYTSDKYIPFSNLYLQLSDSDMIASKVAQLEHVYAQYDTASWFNDSVYMQNKATQSGLDSEVLDAHFHTAGFYGKDGDFLHFVQYGQWEDVSPIATFDANYYFKSKAADFYNVKLSQVTSAQAQNMKDAIHNAGMNAWNHYQQYGTREGIDASTSFDTSAYMEAKLAQMQKSDPGYTMDQLYDAFAGAGLSAAAHYEAYGKAEGLRAVGVPTTYLAMDIQDTGA